VRFVGRQEGERQEGGTKIRRLRRVLAEEFEREALILDVQGAEVRRRGG
jgi:hypothetical protein